MTFKFRTLLTAVSATALMALSGCGDSSTDKPAATAESPWASEAAEKRADIYTDFTLTTDLTLTF